MARLRLRWAGRFTGTSVRDRPKSRRCSSVCSELEPLALSELVPNLREQLDFAGPRSSIVALAHHLRRPAHHQENDESEDQEVNDDGHELAPAKHRRACGL